MPAWIERPIPTPPPWWMLTHEAPAAVLTSAFKSGQSAIASDPSSHRLGLPVGRRHRAGVEMVAADHDRRSELAGAHHLVEAQPQPLALAIAGPADPRRQPLICDPLAGQPDPALQGGIAGDLLEHRAVGRLDVGLLARQRHPAKRALSLAEQGPDVGGQRSRDRRRPARSRRAEPRRAGCFRSRTPPPRRRGSRPSQRSAPRRQPWPGARTRRGRPREARRPPAESSGSARSRSGGRGPRSGR